MFNYRLIYVLNNGGLKKYIYFNELEIDGNSVHLF